MKSKLPLILFCFLILISKIANSAILSIELKQHSDSTPKKSFKNHLSLTEFLIKGTKNDEEKVLIFSYWIAKNITYDLSSLSAMGRNKIPRELLSDRRGVCGCMANLFQQMCDNSNVKCFTIFGKAYGSFIKKYFSIYHLNHAWNSVFINGEWKLVDVTWNTDLANDSKFKKNPDLEWVFMNPSEFAKTHFPDNPAWQLLKSPYSKSEFWSRTIPIEKQYNFKDTLSIMIDSSRATALLSSLQNAYFFNGNKNKYVSSVITLGWRLVFDAKDGNEALLGIRILEALDEELDKEDFIKQRKKYNVPLYETKKYVNQKFNLIDV